MTFEEQDSLMDDGTVDSVTVRGSNASLNLLRRNFGEWCTDLIAESL